MSLPGLLRPGFGVSLSGNGRPSNGRFSILGRTGLALIPLFKSRNRPGG